MDEGHHITVTKKRHTMMLSVAIAVIIALFLFAIYWWLFKNASVMTEDAYIGADIVSITTHIPGTPIALYTDNTQLVEEGQLLVVLDPTDYQIAYERAEIALRQAIRTAIQEEGTAHPQTKPAKNTTASTADLSEYPAVQEAKVDLIEAYIELQRCRILAPIRGYVAKRTVEVGTWVKSGTPLLAIVPLHHLWVDANFKETELENIRQGQPVTVSTDLYGEGVIYHSKVTGIAPGSGRIFSLLPPENATGNWIKVIQRVPVRVYLDPEQTEQAPVLAGLSARVTVDISDKSGDFLTQIPATQEVMSTSVYAIPLEEVNRAIQAILTQEITATHE